MNTGQYLFCEDSRMLRIRKATEYIVCLVCGILDRNSAVLISYLLN